MLGEAAARTCLKNIAAVPIIGVGHTDGKSQNGGDHDPDIVRPEHVDEQNIVAQHLNPIGNGCVGHAHDSEFDELKKARQQGMIFV